MARPERNDVDYFPFMCKEGKAMYVIETKYKNDGFATWLKILRSLATTNYHYLDLSDISEKMFLSSKCNISEEMLENIINDLVNLGEFDRELWEQYSIVFSEKFIESILDAYKKRNNNPLNKKQLLEYLLSLGGSLPSKSTRKPLKSAIKGGDNPQKKVKESKVEEKKEYIKEKRGINSFDREEVKKELLSEVNLKHLAATLEKGVTLNGGNFKLYPDTVGRIKSQFNNFMYVLSLKSMTFTDVNHIKNYFRIFLEKYWNVTESEHVVNKMNREFRKQSYKK